MTFTRKTGRGRPVENETTVDVEEVHRNARSLLSNLVPKARTKVLAQKKSKKERTESVEAVDDEEVVDKKRSSEGPWLIKRYYKVDIISNVQWAYMKPVDISVAFAGISEFQLRRLGLRGVITRQYVSPNVPLCKEWLLSFDGGPKRDCSATVQGQRIILTEELVRDAFFIHEELNPPASQQLFPKHVMRIALEDWFSPRSIAGPIIHFVKSALQPVFPEGVSLDDSDGDEDTSIDPHAKLLDLAAYQFKCVRYEMCQVKKHLQQPNNSRLRETFVGQVLAHLLIHLGIYKLSPEEEANDDTQVIFHEDVGSSKPRGECLIQPLIACFFILIMWIL
ncbi:hypothetical protein R1sor_002833 [Riccia sorocarpa]|uniref:Uncharacterized protein n=1 Tax=Riccia sorocarpa TaxID=122646 RepID=A0ABD3H210_9MARC